MNRRYFFASALPALAANAQKKAAASERLRVGLIGCGGRGRFVAGFLQKFGDVDITAVSDVASSRLDQARQELVGAYQSKSPDGYEDYRRILDRKDIDAVIVATNHHWHSAPFLEACAANKQIYVEKPLGFSIGEGRLMVEAAKKYETRAMVGTQQHGVDQFVRAVEIVRSGKLGEIPLVECWNLHPYGPRAGKHPVTAPPLGMNWDRWLGPAPMAPYQESRLRSNWWFDYSGGMMTDWATHHFDIVCWAMQAYDPIEVTCTGEKTVTKDDADCPDLIHASWRFPKFTATYRYRGFNYFHPVQNRTRDHGIIFYGTRATLIVDRYGLELWTENEKNPKEKLEDMPKPATEAVWYRAFVDYAKGLRDSPYDFEKSHRSTSVCHLANIAYHVKRPIQWNAQSEQIEHDAEANAMILAKRREGYELPKV